MKRYVGESLLLLNALLVAGLAWMWFSPKEGLRNSHWTVPRAQKTNFDDMVPALGKPQAMDQSQFLAMLDRPLFSATRRPPPPPPPPASEAPPPPPDYLSTAVLSGIYSSTDKKLGGVIIKFNGKDKALPLRGALDGWTLSSIADNRVYFTRGAETRELRLQKAKLQVGYGPSVGSNAPTAPQINPLEAGSTPSAEAPPPRRASLGGRRTAR
ncbi:hypothetical protein GCM10027082_02570 [Comamonas humi]